MIYVVLGMHKSGTTLVSMLLHHAGINMVEAPPTVNYEAGGFYEREATYRLNLALIDEPPDCLELHRPPAHLHNAKMLRDSMSDVVGRVSSAHKDWGFKDPRTCLVYTAWKAVLPPHKLIVVYRPVEGMWHRFDNVGKRFWLKVPRAISVVRRWCEYNQAIIGILRNVHRNDYIVVSYPDLLTGKSEYERLERFISRKLVDKRRKPSSGRQVSGLLLGFAKRLVAATSEYRYQQIIEQLSAYRAGSRVG